LAGINVLTLLGCLTQTQPEKVYLHAIDSRKGGCIDTKQQHAT